MTLAGCNDGKECHYIFVPYDTLDIITRYNHQLPYTDTGMTSLAPSRNAERQQ